MKEKLIETNNGKIFYYTDILSSQDPTVVFLHGLSSNHTTWLNAAEILRKNNTNSIAPDLRGHGLSDKTKKRTLYSFSVFSDDIKKIIDNEGLSKIILVGYSYGGSIAIDFAIRYPEVMDGLILISANHVSPFKYRGINFLSPLAYYFLNALAFIFLWQKRKNYYYYRQGQSKGYWHSVWVGLNTMPLAVNFWMLSRMLLINFKNIISLIKAPTLIIRAEGDPFLTEAETKDIAKAIKNAKIIIPEHGSHFLASRSQNEIAEIIVGFVKGRFVAGEIDRK